MRYNHNGVISEITSLPGCDQIAVFHNTWVPKKDQHFGRGSAAHIDRLVEARQLGYDFAICTVVHTNTAERAILHKNGWKLFTHFHSSKTGSDVELWGKYITVLDQNHNPVCNKHPKCQEEYEYCTCAMKAGWDCKAQGCGRDCNVTHAPHCANSVK